jgi:hypothetical protein
MITIWHLLGAMSVGFPIGWFCCARLTEGGRQ